MKNRKLTIAECCLKYGVGAYNIDKCRIGSDVIKTSGRVSDTVAYGHYKNQGDTYHTGRFPSNFILSHTAACELLGKRPVLVVAL